MFDIGPTPSAGVPAFLVIGKVSGGGKQSNACGSGEERRRPASYGITVGLMFHLYGQFYCSRTTKTIKKKTCFRRLQKRCP